MESLHFAYRYLRFANVWLNITICRLDLPVYFTGGKQGYYVLLCPFRYILCVCVLYVHEHTNPSFSPFFVKQVIACQLQFSLQSQSSLLLTVCCPDCIITCYFSSDYFLGSFWFSSQDQDMSVGVLPYYNLFAFLSW